MVVGSAIGVAEQVGRSHGGQGAFGFQQELPGRQSAAEADERAMGAGHAVAGREEGAPPVAARRAWLMACA